MKPNGDRHRDDSGQFETHPARATRAIVEDVPASQSKQIRNYVAVALFVAGGVWGAFAYLSHYAQAGDLKETAAEVKALVPRVSVLEEQAKQTKDFHRAFMEQLHEIARSPHVRAREIPTPYRPPLEQEKP